jgi:hypothetical protein
MTGCLPKQGVGNAEKELTDRLQQLNAKLTAAISAPSMTVPASRLGGGGADTSSLSSYQAGYG